MCRYSQKLDEPVCDVFAEICDGYVELFRSRDAAAGEAEAEVVEYFGGIAPAGSATSGESTFADGAELPAREVSAQTLTNIVQYIIDLYVSADSLDY